MRWFDLIRAQGRGISERKEPTKVITGLYEEGEDERRPHRAPRASGSRCLLCPPVDELVPAVSRASDARTCGYSDAPIVQVAEPERQR